MSFQIKYPNGNISINILPFFGTAPRKNIRKMLMLARQHCSADDRLELIKTLTAESVQIKEVLNTVKELRGQIGNVLTPYFDHRIDIGGTTSWENALIKQRKRLLKSIEILEEVWPG